MFHKKKWPTQIHVSHLREGYILHCKNHSDSNNNFSETDIIKILDFLIDDIFVTFEGRVFQHNIGVSMGINCTPLLVDLFLLFL